MLLLRRTPLWLGPEVRLSRLDGPFGARAGMSSAIDVLGNQDN